MTDLKIQLVALATLVALVASLSMADNAFAQKYAKSDLQSIVDAYESAIQQARADFLDAVKKSNDDARSAVQLGLPIDQINENSREAIQTARDNLKAAILEAQMEARASLLQLKAEIDARS